MTASDWAPLFEAIASVLGALLTTLAAIYVPKAIAAFEARTGVVVTDQERAAVQGALTTAAGLIQTKLDQGLLKVADIHPENLVVIAAANSALARVPDSAAAQGTSVASAAAIVASRVDTTTKPTVGILQSGAKP